MRQRYTGVNDRHLCELLEREHSIRLNPEALRRRLRAAGLAPKRKRRARKYRSRRERRAASGMLLQIDASRHDWLEGRGRHLARLTLQIERQKWRSTPAGCRVTVYEHLNGTLSLGFGTHEMGRYCSDGTPLKTGAGKGLN